MPPWLAESSYGTIHWRFTYEQRVGTFGPEVPVDPGAPAQDRLLGYTGRVDEQEYAALESQGYIASDRIGKAGVEGHYEEYLRVTPGTKQIEKDATGREVRVIDEQAAEAGNNLILSIDLDLQKKTTELVQNAARGGQAAAVVMDVDTGRVRHW